MSDGRSAHRTALFDGGPSEFEICRAWLVANGGNTSGLDKPPIDLLLRTRAVMEKSGDHICLYWLHSVLITARKASCFKVDDGLRGLKSASRKGNKAKNSNGACNAAPLLKAKSWG